MYEAVKMFATVFRTVCWWWFTLLMYVSAAWFDNIKQNLA